MINYKEEHRLSDIERQIHSIINEGYDVRAVIFKHEFLKELCRLENSYLYLHEDKANQVFRIAGVPVGIEYGDGINGNYAIHYVNNVMM